MATSLNRTYEVTLPTTFKKWSAFLDFTSDLDWWAAFDLNPRCVFGGYANELLAKAFAPIALVAAVLLLSTGAHCAAALWRLRSELAADGRRRFSSMLGRPSFAEGSLLRSSVAVQTGASQACHSLRCALADGLLRPFPFCLFVVFIFLPSVSTAIFQVLPAIGLGRGWAGALGGLGLSAHRAARRCVCGIQDSAPPLPHRPTSCVKCAASSPLCAPLQVQACRGFWYADGDGAGGAGSAKHYFMRPQSDVRCSPTTESHRALQQTMWALAILWPIGGILLLALLLWLIRKPLREGHSSALVDASQFVHSDCAWRLGLGLVEAPHGVAMLTDVLPHSLTSVLSYTVVEAPPPPGDAWYVGPPAH